MAAAALFRSVAKKMARGGARSGPGCSLPPLTSKEAAHVHHRLLHTSPTTGNNKDIWTVLAKARPGVAYFTVFTSVFYVYGVALPEKKELIAKLDAFSEERSDLIGAIQAITHEYQHVRSMLPSGHRKQCDGATEKETKVHDLEDKIAKLHGTKELHDAMKKLQAEITELKIALELTPSQGKDEKSS